MHLTSLLLVFVVLAQACVCLQGSLNDYTFYSKEAKADKNVQVYLPPNYDDTRAYPLIIFLHGKELTHTDYPQVVQQIEILSQNGQLEESIVVKPNGNWAAPTPSSQWDCDAMPSWWINNHLYGNYEKYITEDLLKWISSRYLYDESRVVLSGHSAGGFGALWIGFRNARLFSAVLAFSPVVQVQQVADDLLTTNDRWWVTVDLAGAKTVSDFYAPLVPVPDSAEMSPALGYFSDFQWKMNYAFSPASGTPSSLPPFVYDASQVHNIFVGSPERSEVGGATIDSSVYAKWKAYSIDDLARSKRADIETLDFVYHDVGIYDQTFLQDDGDALQSVLTRYDINYYYEQFSTGDNCVQCVPPSCGATDYQCGTHFADGDGLRHGACVSRFYNALPYTGDIGSRIRIAFPKLNAVWASIPRSPATRSNTSNTNKSSSRRSSSLSSSSSSTMLCSLMLTVATIIFTVL